MNLSELSIDQLNNLQEEITQEIKLRRLSQQKDLLEKMRAMAVEGGFTLESLVAEVLPNEETKEKKRSVPAKYRHPDNSALTWTGRGKRPRWIGEQLLQGKTIEDLMI